MISSLVTSPNSIRRYRLSLKLPRFIERVHAGFPSPAAGYTEGTLDLDRLLVRNKPATFIVEATGNSMAPGILPGDLLIVDRSLPVLHNSIVIAAVANEFVCKRVDAIFEHQATLISDNPEYPEPIPINADVEIFGVVSSQIRRLRT